MNVKKSNYIYSLFLDHDLCFNFDDSVLIV